MSSLSSLPLNESKEEEGEQQEEITFPDSVSLKKEKKIDLLFVYRIIQIKWQQM